MQSTHGDFSVIFVSFWCAKACICLVFCIIESVALTLRENVIAKGPIEMVHDDLIFFLNKAAVSFSSSFPLFCHFGDFSSDSDVLYISR